MINRLCCAFIILATSVHVAPAQQPSTLFGRGIDSSPQWPMVRGRDPLLPGERGSAASIELPLNRSAFGQKNKEITDPGTGVALRLKSGEIVDPGTGVALHRPSEITDPGVGVSLHQASPSIRELAPAASVQIIVSPAAAPLSTLPSARSDLTEDPYASVSRERYDDSGVPPVSFMDLDSGLRDCDIPFDQLERRSPFCASAAMKGGRRCERFSYSQFPEVLKLTVENNDGSTELCSATLIAFNWALTAAHCFLGGSPSADYAATKDGSDVRWAPGGTGLPFARAFVEAENAKMLLPQDRARIAQAVVIYGRYGGAYSDPQYRDDLALIQLAGGYSAQVAQPARLAEPNEFAASSTLAGYGYSNADGGTLGKFNVTWPVPLQRDKSQLDFAPSKGGPIRSAFCQGDSGGPVLAGRYRGCKPVDIAPEQRPRLIQGIISFNYLGSGAGHTDAQIASSMCRNGREMVMQDITVTERHRWICRITGNAPLGCEH